MQAVVLFMEEIKKYLSEKDGVAHPVSLYAATKRANELIAHSYSHIYGLPCQALDFLQYMDLWEDQICPMIFAKAILEKSL